MTKNQMIDTLVGFSLQVAATDSQASWLKEIFRRGFRGFASMSSTELLRELQFRGLAAFDDGFSEEDIDDAIDGSRLNDLPLHESLTFGDELGTR